MLDNANQALLFLVDTLFALYIIVVIGRVLLQATHAPFNNPVCQFVHRVTAPPVRILARLIPRWRNVDVAAIVFAVLLCFVNIQLDMLISAMAFSAQAVAMAVWWAVLKALILLCDLYFFTILVQALLSWLSPNQYSPATAVLWTINEPLLRPVRQRMPSIGGIDLSPLVLLIGLQVISMLLPLPLVFR